MKDTGYHPWLDEEDLLPGQNWKIEIRRIIRDPNSLVVVCLSRNSVTKRGTVQREIKWALDVLEEMPEGAIYLIPARLEDYQPPERLSDLHWVDLFAPNGFERLKRALDSELGERQPSRQPSKPELIFFPPFSQWPKIAHVVNEAGKNLWLQFGEELLSAGDIQREIERLGGYARGAIIPADYSYNRINRAPFAFRFPVFEWVARGKFRYLGPNYNYTGSIIWKPRGESEKKVGGWKSGVCRLWEDPRNG